MNFISICLHCLDMRDFHSHLRETPFLDTLRDRTVFIPMGRAQGHHHSDSLNAEMTGKWTARYCNSTLNADGYRPPENGWFPKTVIEYLQENGYDIFTQMAWFGYDAEGNPDNMGTAALDGGISNFFLKNNPERLKQFYLPRQMSRKELFSQIKRSKKFYAHLFLRETHRPWAQNEGLAALVGKPPPTGKHGWPEDAFCARKAALDHPDEFAALRRRGLAKGASAEGLRVKLTAGRKSCRKEEFPHGRVR